MYHMTCTQTSRQNGRFINISLTATCMVKTCFKVKRILYGMQWQPGQPFLINHWIGVLAWVLKPLAERPLSIAVPRYVILSELFTHCGCCGLCSVTLSEWFVLYHHELVVHAPSPWASGSCSITLSEWFVLQHPEQVVRAPAPWVSGSCSITLSGWFVLHQPEQVVHAQSPWVSCEITPDFRAVCCINVFSKLPNQFFFPPLTRSCL